MILTSFFFTSCTYCGSTDCIQQDLSKSFGLSPGMNKQEVLNVMGSPIRSDFEKNVEEWFYCSTQVGFDQQLVLFFHEGLLVSKHNYTVTIEDVGGVPGSCENFIKMGTYYVPDEVKEIRLRVY
jgi:hypothetical protein